MQLHSILSAVGVICIYIGASAMDSDSMIIPIALVLMGLAFVWIGAKESGGLRKTWKRRRK
jgi:hypothetical protein